MEDRKTKVIISTLIIILVVSFGIIAYLLKKDDTSQERNSSQDTSESKAKESTDYDTDSSGDSPISAEEAGKIVTDKYGGTIKNVENDHHDGKSVWEVEVRDSKDGRIEVKVDKQTGEILKKEQD